MKLFFALSACLALVSVAGCAALALDHDGAARARAVALMQDGFQANGQATMERLVQDPLQQLCDGAPDDPQKLAARARLEKIELAAVKFPADGKLLGSFAAGEKIAQTGVGLQWSDKAGSVAGGNCYACHQISKQEVSFGNLGPSLFQYGKLRGNSDVVLRYTWSRIYNAKAYNACSNMPRFGHKGILSEQQIKDVMALLLDPQSPVNQ
ncbi:sulfur-oxidizing protein SoxX [Oxalobacteraceae bacterium GrIS 1.11]